MDYRLVYWPPSDEFQNPRWFVHRWVRDFGAETCQCVCAACDDCHHQGVPGWLGHQSGDDRDRALDELMRLARIVPRVQRAAHMVRLATAPVVAATNDGEFSSALADLLLAVTRYNHVKHSQPFPVQPNRAVI